MTDRELLRLALEALEDAQRYGCDNWESLAEAIRKRLKELSENT